MLCLDIEIPCCSPMFLPFRLILMSSECASSSVSLNALILKISLIMTLFGIFKPKVVISKWTGQVSNQGLASSQTTPLCQNERERIHG